MSQVALDSVRRRVAGMHELWLEASDTMDAGQVNHHEREGVLPIAFSVNHMTRIEDQVVHSLFNQQPAIWQRDGWAARTGATVDVDPSGLTDALFGGLIPPAFQKAYVARVVRGGPITMLDGIECWIFQHGIRHLGECGHARALVGLGGMTS